MKKDLVALRFKNELEEATCRDPNPITHIGCGAFQQHVCYCNTPYKHWKLVVACSFNDTLTQSAHLRRTCIAVHDNEQCTVVLGVENVVLVQLNAHVLVHHNRLAGVTVISKKEKTDKKKPECVKLLCRYSVYNV